jgi:uncharacterized protein involved in exopolysaccharide biosynthesis
VIEDERPRRFGRRRTDAGTEPESIEALRAELLLLREENARLTAAQHRGADVGRVLRHARAALPAVDPDDDSIADETTRVLIEGLVIRESLLELCQEIERAMVAFEARLTALQAPISAARSNGHGPSGA